MDFFLRINRLRKRTDGFGFTSSWEQWRTFRGLLVLKRKSNSGPGDFRGITQSCFEFFVEGAGSEDAVFVLLSGPTRTGTYGDHGFASRCLFHLFSFNFFTLLHLLTFCTFSRSAPSQLLLHSALPICLTTRTAVADEQSSRAPSDSRVKLVQFMKPEPGDLSFY